MLIPTNNQICTVINRAATAETPETKLWLAVLIQAVQDLELNNILDQIKDKSKKNEYTNIVRSAVRFFKSKHLGLVCERIDINPEHVIKCIRMKYQNLLVECQVDGAASLNTRA